MNILITGGAGFIGSHLCKRLLEDKHKVYCLDNYITGSKDTIKYLLLDKNFELLEQDVCNRIRLYGKLDWVLHLASPASPKHYMRHPLETLYTGTQGTIECLDVCHRLNAKF